MIQLRLLIPEAIGDVAGLLDYINRQTGFLPDWVGDILDSIDDIGIMNSLLEATGVAPYESYGSWVRGPAQMVTHLGMFAIPGPQGKLEHVIQFGRPVLAGIRPNEFVAAPAAAPANVGQPAGVMQQQQQQQQQQDETMADVIAQAIVDQAMAEAEMRRRYGEWLKTQQQMAELYTKWHEAYPEIVRRAQVQAFRMVQ